MLSTVRSYSPALQEAVLQGQDFYFTTPPPMPNVRVETNGTYVVLPWEQVYGPVPQIRMPISQNLRERVLESVSLAAVETSTPEAQDSPPPFPIEEGPQDDGGGSTNISMGFYQIVRVGVHLFGFTNGMVLSGSVPLPVEFGNPDTNALLKQVFLTLEDSDEQILGSEFPSYPYDPSAITGVLDTTQLTNGTYTLQLGARMNNEVVYLDAPVTVTVSNLIWFPDPCTFGGQGIFVGAQSVFTNGWWEIDIFDDQDNWLGTFPTDFTGIPGPIDSNGFFAWPDYYDPTIPDPYINDKGFTLDNTDQNGNQNPSTSYTLEMIAYSPDGAQMRGGGGGLPPYVFVTNKVFIEPAWNYGTRAVMCYMQVFPPWKPGADDVRILNETLWNIEEPFHPNLLGTFVLPYQIQTLNDWSNVVWHLSYPVCRDFFYFGHGSEDALGDGNTCFTIQDAHTFFRNNSKDPLTATNRHPFRFVFLDGCNTADGNWPQAFGIPKQKGMKITDFTQKRGIRPRAFMGWNRKKVFSSVLGGSQLNPDHSTWVSTFWNTWATRDASGGPRYNISEARDAANTASPNAKLGMMIYGADNLVIDY